MLDKRRSIPSRVLVTERSQAVYLTLPVYLAGTFRGDGTSRLTSDAAGIHAS
jgi:hypothetical protein